MSVAVLVEETRILRAPDAWLEADYFESTDTIRTSELISALSYALDLTEGRSMGHSVRSCVMGMRLAQHIGLSMEEQSDLYYALLLKDAGCSSNSSRLFHILNADEIRAKRDVKTTDWTKVGFDSLNFALTHVATESPLPQRMWRLLQVAATQQVDSRDLVKIRCERGSFIAKKLGFSDAVAEGIHSLDEHWNGGGYPNHLMGEEIPIFSRIAGEPLPDARSGSMKRVEKKPGAGLR